MKIKLSLTWQIDVNKNVYRPKNIIQPIDTKNSEKIHEFSCSQKWNLSHLKQRMYSAYSMQCAAEGARGFIGYSKRIRHQMAVW